MASPLARYLPLMAGGFTLLAGIAASWAVTDVVTAWERNQQQSRDIQRLATIRAQLESELNTTMYATHGLAALVASDPELPEERLLRMARALLRNNPHTRHFAVAPDNVVRFVYPLEGNEAALGLDLGSQPGQQAAVERAMAQRRLIITGPVELVQGGRAIATREPVFITRNGEQHYWGLVTAIVRMDSLFGAAGLLDNHSGLDLALRNLDDNAVLLGDSALFRDNTLRQDVRLHGATWELAARPRQTTSSHPYWFGFGLVLSLAGSLGAWRLTGQGLALRRSEEKYRTLVEQLNDGVCIAQDGVLRYVNPRLCEMTERTEAWLIGRPFGGLIAPEYREELQRRHAARMRGESFGATYELQILRPSGPPLHARINANLVDWQGRPAALVTVTDMSEQKALQQALRRSRDRLQAMIRAMPDIGFIIDDQGRYLDVIGGNSEHYSNSDGLVGRRLGDTLPPPLANQFMQVIHATLASDSMELFEYRLGVDEVRGTPSTPPFDTQWFEARVVPLHAFGSERPAVLWLAFNITSRKEIEASLREREAAYEALVENSPDVISRLDQDLRILYTNSVAERYTGVPPADLVGRRRPDIPEDPALAAELEQRLRRVLQEGRMHMFDFRQRAPDGRLLFFECRAIPEPGEAGRTTTILVLEREITDRKHSEQQQRLAASVFQHTSEAMLVSDAYRRVVRCNPAYYELTGFQPSDLIGRPAPLLTSTQSWEHLDDEAWQHLGQRGRWQGELQARGRDGIRFPAWVTVTTIRDESGTVSHYLLTLADISSRKQQEARLRHDATHDPLTALPNRALLMDRLAVAIAQARRDEQQLAVLFIDLDDFKPVNDSLGHHVGDMVLRQLAQRLTARLRETDTVARLGGDEFVIVLTPPVDTAAAEAVATAILEHIGQPVRVNGHECKVTASIGISLFPDHGGEPETLIAAADAAMYRAKITGGSHHAAGPGPHGEPA